MKTIFPLLAILFACLLSFNLKAQEIEFDLKNYKTTDYKRSSLDLTFDLTESASNSENQNGSSYFSSDSAFQFNFNINPKYSFIHSNRKKVETINTQFSIDASSRKTGKISWDTLNNTGLESNNIGTGLSGSYDLDLYKDSDSKYFLHLYSSASINTFIRNYYKKSYDVNYQENTSDLNLLDSKQSGYLYPLSIDFEIGYGFGRIEYVEDAVEALYILNDLNQSGKLKKSMDDDEISSFADRITELRKERYFDSRLYRKKVMKELIVFLNENGYVNEGDIDVYNIVSDFHFHGNIATRQAGSKFIISGNPNFSKYISTYKNFYDDAPTERIQNSKEFGILLRYLYCNPISVKWQSDFNVDGMLSRNWLNGGRKYDYQDEFSKYTISNNLFSGSINYSLGYYPNTRSNYTASVNSSFTFENNNDSGHKELNWGSSINLAAHYYLSEQLRLDGYFNAGYNIARSGDDIFVSKDQLGSNYSGFNQGFMIGLSYFIF